MAKQVSTIFIQNEEVLGPTKALEKVISIVERYEYEIQHSDPLRATPELSRLLTSSCGADRPAQTKPTLARSTQGDDWHPLGGNTA